MAVFQDLPPEIVDRIVKLIPERDERIDKPSNHLGLSLVARDWVDRGQRALLVHLVLRGDADAAGFIKCCVVRRTRTKAPLVARSVVLVGVSAEAAQYLFEYGLQPRKLGMTYHRGFPWKLLHSLSKRCRMLFITFDPLLTAPRRSSQPLFDGHRRAAP